MSTIKIPGQCGTHHFLSYFIEQKLRQNAKPVIQEGEEVKSSHWKGHKIFGNSNLIYHRGYFHSQEGILLIDFWNIYKILPPFLRFLLIIQARLFYL